MIDIRKSMKPTIAVDFDGVIREQTDWHPGPIDGTPTLGIQLLLQDLRDKGCKILIYTVRAYDRIVNGQQEPNQVQELHEWLKRYNVPYDEIHTDPWKPIVTLFLDDRAVRFKNINQARGHLLEILELE